MGSPEETGGRALYGGVSRSQRRLEVCYRRVMAKAGEKLPPFCGEVEIYSLPGQQVNGAAFGRSIGITEGRCSWTTARWRPSSPTSWATSPTATPS